MANDANNATTKEERLIIEQKIWTWLIWWGMPHNPLMCKIEWTKHFSVLILRIHSCHVAKWNKRLDMSRGGEENNLSSIIPPLPKNPKTQTTLRIAIIPFHLPKQQ